MLEPKALELRAIAPEARASHTVTADLIPKNDQSPIQQLPIELLEAIFFDTNSISPRDYSSQPQWVLRQVCRLWRNVSTSSPRLWKELCVHVHTAAKLRDAKSLLRLALSYTKEMDLVITFDTSSSALVHGELTLTLLDLLTTQSRQWRTIHFISLDAACTRALTRARGSLPRLRELHIDSTPDARVYEEIAAFAHAPLLERLYLNGARMDCQSLYAQLRRFSVMGATYRSSLVSVLRECPRLEQVTMQSRAPSFERAASQTLKALTLWSTPSDLALVHLPNLRHLDIRGFSITPALPFIHSFIKSSQCPLVALRLVNCDLSVGSLVDVLKLVPLLEHLEIGFQGIVSQSATVFVVNVDQALSRLMFAFGVMKREDEQVFALVPKLRTLDISLASGCGSESDYTFHRSAKVIAMLRRRHAQNQMVTSYSFGLEVVLIS